GVQPEEMVPDLGPERRGDLAGIELEDRRLDVGRQLSPLQAAEAASVLARCVLGVLLGQLAEVLPLEQERVHMHGPLPGGLPALLALARLGQKQDMAGLEGEPDLELLPVLLQVLADLLLGYRPAEGDPPA